MIIKVYNLISLWGQKRLAIVVALSFALNLISFPRLETSITRPWVPSEQYCARIREQASDPVEVCYWHGNSHADDTYRLSNEVNKVGDAITTMR